MYCFVMDIAGTGICRPKGYYDQTYTENKEHLSVSSSSIKKVSVQESSNWSYLQSGVPASSAHGHAVTGDAQTTDAVVVAQQDTHALASESIPDIAVVVVVPRE